MKIIDRYLLRQFLWTFVVCYLSLTDERGAMVGTEHAELPRRE